MIPWLDKQDINTFPAVDTALDEPDGLLAVGGDLSTPRLLAAYRKGIFPWYNNNEPILWWSPAQRMVIFTKDIHISRSMRRVFRQDHFEFSYNTAFHDVISACAVPRRHLEGSWIHADMLDAYIGLHRQGYAHSVECWQHQQLVGGIYGVVLGGVFFGESMFSRVSNASKAALIMTAQQDHIELIDCQFYTAHLASMGGQLISRAAFLEQLKIYNIC